MKNYQKYLWAFIAIAALGLFVWQFFNPTTPKIQDLRDRAEGFLTENLDRVAITPEPLRGPINQPISELTSERIVEWTNNHRKDAGLNTLDQNKTLSASAALKAQDMLENQYFAHTAPDGTKLGDLVATVGYEYVLIGENLALGNFADEQALVQAWMDSPGHRENILHTSYTEIGIGLSRGVFEGNEVWIAVQHFGKPKSACPPIDESILARINENKKELEHLESEIKQKEQELENTEPKRGAAYNQKVREYNQLADQYNELSKETKQLVQTYNSQVQAFNQCSKG
ncbi:MAG: CAP domain-containing protein [Candidatus Spechtbacterales bacterium]|nr:CAP domain-containing protein [Candidatus Spechtbacterales bacterium]